MTLAAFNHLDGSLLGYASCPRLSHGTAEGQKRAVLRREAIPLFPLFLPLETSLPLTLLSDSYRRV